MRYINDGIKDVKTLMNKEYLLTNGLGGYSFGTINGTNIRKYHSLYTVSKRPPVERYHAISKFDEVIELAGKTYSLTGEISSVDDKIIDHLISYDKKGSCEFNYLIEGVKIKKEIAFEYMTNNLAVKYTVESDESLELTITPFVNIRDHHDTEEPILSEYDISSEANCLKIRHDLLEIYISHSACFVEGLGMSEQSYYPIETRRGYPDSEKHVIPGSLKYKIKEGVTEVFITISDENQALDAERIIRKEKLRMRELVDKSGVEDEDFKSLVESSDSFIVHRESTGKKSIIAGYPWFTDWGRDTMIALPGLTLYTGRQAEALEMIETFLAHSKSGIIPNNFPDEVEEPMYNTSDGTLWLFNALFEYYKSTSDDGALKRLMPKLHEIIDFHINGTINDIFLDTDGLLSTGNKETQLTWMDVKVDGWVVTPRHGKAVEINALFYNALEIMNFFSEEIGEIPHYKEVSFKLKRVFNELFWNKEKGRLYDLFMDGELIDIIRPNMILSISLPFPILEKSKWEAVVNTVKDELLFPYGLRSVSRDDKDYHGKYEGKLLDRDSAYHRGTGWGWLMGPYLEAHYKTFGDKEYISGTLEKTKPHIREGVIGSFSENFEGDAPHAQRGCPAQAWSVAEIIRMIKLIEA